jgi:hypothetical protein
MCHIYMYIGMWDEQKKQVALDNEQSTRYVHTIYTIIFMLDVGTYTDIYIHIYIGILLHPIR